MLRPFFLIAFFASCGWVVFLSSARADTNCAPIKSDVERLGCYDRLYQPKSAKEVEPIPSSEASDDSFGKEMIEVADPITGIESVIKSITVQPFGERVFRLENGQVWREIEAGRSRFKKNMQVEIVRTAFGTYQLKAGKGRRTKVRRLN